MPYYYPLRKHRDAARIVPGLQRLRALMAEQVPRRGLDDSLLLATWNLREFDTPSWGRRTTDAYYFIAEVLSHFDLIAIQEVRSDLDALERTMRILGPTWQFMVTDITEGRRGNDERLAFVYDSRRVRPTGLVGEIVIPDTPNGPAVQLARTPFVCEFACGWAKLQLATVHILWGSDAENDPERVAEINTLARLLSNRAKKMASAQDANLVLLGDFNIFRPESHTMQALTSHGWVIPAGIRDIPGSNVAKDKKYDQIAVRNRLNRLAFSGKAGVVDAFEAVFRDEDADAYLAERSQGRPQPYAYRSWRTYQLSDHLPMWVELDIGYADEYLGEIAAAIPAPGPG